MPDTFLKDPNAILDYEFDWATNWLEAGEAITSHDLLVHGPSGVTDLTVDSSTEASGVVTVWLSGGQNGIVYQLVCRIQTSMNRTDDRTARVDVRHR